MYKLCSKQGYRKVVFNILAHKGKYIITLRPNAFTISLSNVTLFLSYVIIQYGTKISLHNTLSIAFVMLLSVMLPLCYRCCFVINIVTSSLRYCSFIDIVTLMNRLQYNTWYVLEISSKLKSVR